MYAREVQKIFREENKEASRAVSVWVGVLSELLLLVLISSALIPSSSPTVFILTFSFSWPLPHWAQEPFDMWEHFLGPDTSHPWLHAGGEERGRERVGGDCGRVGWVEVQERWKQRGRIGVSAKIRTFPFSLNPFLRRSLLRIPLSAWLPPPCC